MGCVKPSYIKNFAKELLKTYNGVFTGDFEHNKDKVAEYTNIKNKGIRNRIAGYLTRHAQSKGE
ncbi:MAG: 30S ribosomal protein S17e [Methanotrichaceae archaeon]